MSDTAHSANAPSGSGLRFQRILLKISGEALAGDRGVGFDFERIGFFADQIVDVARMGVQLGLVIGGGNIVRGTQLSQMGMDRVGADYMGMLGTVINAMALQDVLEKKGLDTRVMTAIRMEELAEPYIRRRALRHFATSVDGVYSADPKKDPNATMYETISYRDVMLEELRVMDQTAITLCKENQLPLVVLNLHRQGAIARAIRGERVGTLVS